MDERYLTHCSQILQLNKCINESLFSQNTDHFDKGTPNMFLGCGVPALPPNLDFSTTFIKNCGRGNSLGATACPKTVVGACKDCSL